MAINKKLINFKTKKLFLGPNGINQYTSSETLNSSTLKTDWTNSPDANGFIGNIPWHSIVTIEDTNELWSHGEYYGGNIAGKTITVGGSTLTVPSKMSDLTDDLTKTSGLVASASGISIDRNWNEVPKIIYDSLLQSNGTYMIQITWDSAIYCGIFPYKEVHQNNVKYTNLAECPVITTDEEVVLTSCGYVPSSKGRLYLKLGPGSRKTTENIADTEVQMATKPSLFIASDKQDLILGSLTFNFRKLL